MTVLSKTPSARTWLERLDEVDRDTAKDLIDEILLVNREDFVAGLDALINDIVGIQSNSVHKVALFAERPIKKVFGNIPSFFPNGRRGRAEGKGRPPIVVDPRDQEVGSEGIVAQFITDYCRRNSWACLNHPGPTKMRKSKIREIVIVTDFIGSGQRINTMLESFRYVATVRSWRSYGYLKFTVLAYSGTSEGIEFLRSHRLQPYVRIVAACPTINNTFFGNQRLEVEALCRSYPNGHSDPLGYRGAASLIAFAHGCPNNVPPILHSGASGWVPLFRGRSTTNVSESFLSGEHDGVIDQRAAKLLGTTEARRQMNSPSQQRWVSLMLILAATEGGLRTSHDISARTHLSLDEVSDLSSMATKARYLDIDGRLTRLGRYELNRLRRRRARSPLLADEKNEYYYPTQLRAP